MSKCVTIWTVYQHPDDYPDWWVLRGYDLLPGALQRHRFFFTGRTLDEVRAKVPPATLCVGRQPADHPAIYECWVASTDIPQIARLIDQPPASARHTLLSRKPPARALREPARRDPATETSHEKTTSFPSPRLSADDDVTSRAKRINLKSADQETLDLEALLAVVSQHVTEGEARVQRIAAAIERRLKFGLTTELAENLLNTMLVTLSLLIDSQARIRAALHYRKSK